MRCSRGGRRLTAATSGIYSYYRKYAWDSLPAVIPHYMQKDFAVVREACRRRACRHIRSRGIGDTYELNHYVLARLWLGIRDCECRRGWSIKFCDAYSTAHPKRALKEATDACLKKSFITIARFPMCRSKVKRRSQSREAGMQSAIEKLTGAKAQAPRCRTVRSRGAWGDLCLMCEAMLPGKDLEIQNLRAGGRKQGSDRRENFRTAQISSGQCGRGRFPGEGSAWRDRTHV